jgi:hypothetical protein
MPRKCRPGNALRGVIVPVSAGLRVGFAPIRSRSSPVGYRNAVAVAGLALVVVRSLHFAPPLLTCENVRLIPKNLPVWAAKWITVE